VCNIVFFFNILNNTFLLPLDIRSTAQEIQCYLLFYWNRTVTIMYCVLFYVLLVFPDRALLDAYHKYLLYFLSLICTI